MISGKIHSWESMGLVDGPGIRTVVFLQGCRLRCLYCHNPDTWAKEGGTLETVDEVMARLRRFRPYYGTEGGVTFSGGEPLLQREFLTEILSRCRQEGIHTCLDTAGCGAGGYEEILKILIWCFLISNITRRKATAVSPAAHRKNPCIFCPWYRKWGFRCGCGMWWFPVSQTAKNIWKDFGAISRRSGVYSGWNCCPTTPWAYTNIPACRSLTLLRMYRRRMPKH